MQRAFPKHLGGNDDHGGNIAQFEELVLADPSLQIKSGVQWGLFGAAVLHLGTERHHDELLPGDHGARHPRRIRDDRDRSRLGCRQHRARPRPTTSTPATSCSTPRSAPPGRTTSATPRRTAARRSSSRSSSRRASTTACTRSTCRSATSPASSCPASAARTTASRAGSTASTTAGCTSPTSGCRATMLLNRYGDVDEHGVYTSSIASPGRRFFTMLGTLVQGRVSLDGVGAWSSASWPSRSRSPTRRSGASSPARTTTEEMVLLDYQRHQRRLLPHLATTYAMSFAHERFLEQFDARVLGRARHPGRARGPRDARRCAQAAQHLVGARDPAGVPRGHRRRGLSSPRTASCCLRADMDVYATFEGDNNVLLQLVAKRLLTDYSRKFAGADAGALAQYVAGQVGEVAVNRSGPAPVRAERAGLRLHRAVGRVRPRHRLPAPAAHRPRAHDGRRARRASQERAPAVEGGVRGAVQREPERAHRGGTGARRAAAVGGVHRRRSSRSPIQAPSRCSPGCATCSGSG